MEVEDFLRTRPPRLLRVAVLLTGRQPTPRTWCRTCSRRSCCAGARARRPTTSTPTCGACSSTPGSRAAAASSKELVHHDVVTSDMRAPASPDPARHVVDSQVLWDAVTELPPRQRAAVVLRFYEDLPDVEGAAALGCSTGNFRVLVHRGVAALRERSGLHEHHRQPSADRGAGEADRDEGSPAMTTTLRTRDPGPELPGLVETLDSASAHTFDLAALRRRRRRPGAHAAAGVGRGSRPAGSRRGPGRGRAHLVAGARSRRDAGGEAAGHVDAAPAPAATATTTPPTVLVPEVDRRLVPDAVLPAAEEVGDGRDPSTTSASTPTCRSCRVRSATRACRGWCPRAAGRRATTTRATRGRARSTSPSPCSPAGRGRTRSPRRCRHRPVPLGRPGQVAPRRVGRADGSSSRARTSSVRAVLRAVARSGDVLVGVEVVDARGADQAQVDAQRLADLVLQRARHRDAGRAGLTPPARLGGCPAPTARAAAAARARPGRRVRPRPRAGRHAAAGAAPGRRLARAPGERCLVRAGVPVPGLPAGGRRRHAARRRLARRHGPRRRSRAASPLALAVLALARPPPTPLTPRPVTTELPPDRTRPVPAGVVVTGRLSGR